MSRAELRGRPDQVERLTPADREAVDAALVVTRRAIRRLDMLEWVILLVGAALACAAGALVALVLAPMAGWAFRSVWIGASFLLFVVSGAAAIHRIRRDERTHALRTEAKRTEDDG